MNEPLLHCPDPADLPPLRQALAAAGHARPQAAEGCTLVQAVARLAPQQVVLRAADWGPDLAQALAPWAGEPPCALLLIAPPGSAEQQAQAAAAGVDDWLPPALLDQPAALAAALAWAAARATREAARREARDKLRAQLDERKWVDRAKGLLMAARGIGEDDAFRLLRGAAMHAKLRVGEVSRSVIEAAQWAEAVNRAGQLRMLSQRQLLLATQRWAGVDPPRARRLQAESAERIGDTLHHLQALPLSPAQAGALAAVQSAAAALQAGLARLQRQGARGGAEALLDADACAEALLDAAEALTEALEAAGGRALHLVNLCGRQRMRVQRAAKDALLGVLPPAEAARARLPRTLDEFEAALAELEAAPLSSADTRRLLAQAREEALRLLRALRQPDGEPRRLALAGSADSLLAVFEDLTGAYERSLQVLMA